MAICEVDELFVLVNTDRELGRWRRFVTSVSFVNMGADVFSREVEYISRDVN